MQSHGGVNRTGKEGVSWSGIEIWWIWPADIVMEEVTVP